MGNTSARREQIISALFRCLAHQGHETISVKIIASEAGLGAGVIHYHFKSKDEIAVELAKFLVDKYSQKLSSALEIQDTSIEKSTALRNFLVDEFIFDTPVNRVFYNLIQMSFEKTELRSVLGSLLETYRDRVKEALVMVGVPEEKSQKAALGVVALTEGLAIQRSVDPDAFQPAHAQALLAVFIERQCLND